LSVNSVIRIVGLQRSAHPDGEFVLLQNQGLIRECPRGHVVLSDGAIQAGELDCGAYVFQSLEPIPTGAYILLRTGHGEDRWIRSKDGAPVYVVFARRNAPLWPECYGGLHVLHTQHSFVEREPVCVG
jgi:hypothetical protein